ncbi:MAG: hypothetical protein JWM86_1406 [Thermoleophilia bacterium]|nr:hypothetical protein [Thermoleophilia bacterium]
MRIRCGGVVHDVVVGTNERLIGLASRQHGRVARRQLASVGIPNGTISRLVKDAILLPRPGAVFAVGHVAPSRDAELMEAVLAAGEGAVVSGLAAAGLWEITRRKAPRIEITTHHHPRSMPRGIIVRARTEVPMSERSAVRGIPTTTPLRTIADLSRRLQPDEVRFAIHEALYLALFTLDELASFAEARRGTRGCRPLRQALDDYRAGDTGSRSNLEAAVGMHIGDRFPVTPRLNWATPVDGGTVMTDLCWPELGICCEVDGPVHDLPATRRRDEERSRRLTAARWSVFRIDYREFERDPNAACTPVVDALWAAVSRQAT